MTVSCDCCVLSRRGLCYGPITRPEESYRVWCVSECDQVQPGPPTAGSVPGEKKFFRPVTWADHKTGKADSVAARLWLGLKGLNCTSDK
jgi:hypothetical protein